MTDINKEANKMDNTYYIVRCDRSGVFAGNIVERNGQEVTMSDARCLWYWDGAASLMQLAKDGTSDPRNCKFTVSVDSLTVLDAIEILPCTKTAEKSIRSVKEWRA